MNSLIEQMLQPYQAHTVPDREHAIKEVVQEIVLCGLSRAGFFQSAAFYGGTALRIFYGLDRFSEDLDFSLMSADAGFDLAAHLPMLEKEVRSYGLHFSAEERKKAVDSAVKSAFLKGNTKEHLLLFFAGNSLAESVAATKSIRVKLEVDTDPPPYAAFERKYRLLPIPYEINLYDMPSLFAGKIHAVLCRAWKSRVKGRDLYDYVFYLSKGARVNIPHLQARLAQSGFIGADRALTIEDIRTLLCARFEQIDYAQARQDVMPFIQNQQALDVWSADFFKGITQSLQ